MRKRAPYLITQRGKHYVRTSYTDHLGKRRDLISSIREGETFEDAARRLTDNVTHSKQATSGHIYAILEVGPQGFIKLGWSAKPWERVGSLQCGNPRQLVLLCYWPAVGGTKEETRLKCEFAFCATRTPRKRILGEWFYPHPKLIGFLKRRSSRADAENIGMAAISQVGDSIATSEAGLNLQVA